MSNNTSKNNGRRSFKSSSADMSEAIDATEECRPGLARPIVVDDADDDAAAAGRELSSEHPTNLVQHMDENTVMVARPGLPYGTVGVAVGLGTPKKSKASSSKAPENEKKTRATLIIAHQMGVFNDPPKGKSKDAITKAAMDVMYSKGGPREDIKRPDSDSCERNLRNSLTAQVKDIVAKAALKKTTLGSKFVPSPLEETASSIARSMADD